MIERSDLFHFSFYKKTHFTGSYRGMRYYITKATVESEPTPKQLAEHANDEEPFKVTTDVMRAYCFPEPYNFENTADEDNTFADFELSEKGLDDACEWLNKQYAAREDYWLHTPKF